jgi:4-hydroxy-3-methylbut-2-en-1-yl diphosphate synthase IspG/GcpE
MSFRSHASSAQVSFLPASLIVILHEHTKYDLPALVACRHCPRPEHDMVAFEHASSVANQVEIPLMGCCGTGLGTGKGVWGGSTSSLLWTPSWYVDADVNVSSARCTLG